VRQSLRAAISAGEPVTGIAQAFQSAAAQAGIKISIIPGDGKQTLTKYRARNHDIYIGQWGSDYWDPNSNVQTFASNTDNADSGTNKTLAWRNDWDALGEFPDCIRACCSLFVRA
jgi:peptide/nickel transport system substrate-binding protein